MRCDEGARELTVTAAPAEGLHKTGYINVQLAMEEGPMGPALPRGAEGLLEKSHCLG